MRVELGGLDLAGCRQSVRNVTVGQMRSSPNADAELECSSQHLTAHARHALRTRARVPQIV